MGGGGWSLTLNPRMCGQSYWFMKPPFFRESFRLDVYFPFCLRVRPRPGPWGGTEGGNWGLGPDPFSPVRWGRLSVTP